MCPISVIETLLLIVYANYLKIFILDTMTLTNPSAASFSARLFQLPEVCLPRAAKSTLLAALKNRDYLNFFRFLDVSNFTPTLGSPPVSPCFQLHYH